MTKSDMISTKNKGEIHRCEWCGVLIYWKYRICCYCMEQIVFEYNQYNI